MGHGSSTTSDVPKFRSGTIVPPTPKRASHRIAVTLRAGRDFVPGVEAPTVSTVATHYADGLPIPRQHMATTIAGRPEVSSETNTRTLSYGERDDADVAARIFRDNKGRVERLTEHGDDALPEVVKVATATATPGRASRSTARTDAGKARRAEQDALIRSVLPTGFAGPLTPAIRSAALDLLAHRDGVAAYTAK